MERRFLLAFVLSFFVLYAWSALFPPPKSLKKNTNSTQTIDVKEDTVNKPLISNQGSLPLSQSQDVPVKPSGEISTIETKKLIIEFSSLGGAIEKVSLKEFNTQLPVKNLAGLADYDNLPFTLDKRENNKIVYVFEDKLVRIIKEYIVSDNDYLINLEVSISSIDNMSKLNITMLKMLKQVKPL